MQTQLRAEGEMAIMKTSAMNKVKFWRLVETAKNESDGDLEVQVSILARKLSELDPEEILGFRRLLEEHMALACRWDLRGAAHIINEGCTDKTFEAFRAWLITQGRKVFEDVCNDPEILEDMADGDVLCEDLLEVPERAYKAKTKSSLPPHEPLEIEPVGEEWVEEDLPNMFPRLWAKFGEES